MEGTGDAKPFSKAISRPTGSFAGGHLLGRAPWEPQDNDAWFSYWADVEVDEHSDARDRLIAHLVSENRALRRAMGGLSRIGDEVLMALAGMSKDGTGKEPVRPPQASPQASPPSNFSNSGCQASVGLIRLPELGRPTTSPSGSPLAGTGAEVPALLLPPPPESTSSGFVFSIRKVDGGELGLDVVEAGEALRVEAILHGGAVEAWNRQLVAGREASAGDVERLVRPGDLILKVNNISGNPLLMMNECRDQKLLKLSMARGLSGENPNEEPRLQDRSATPPPTKDFCERAQRTPERTPERPHDKAAGGRGRSELFAVI